VILMSSHEPNKDTNWKDLYQKEHVKVLTLEQKLSDMKLEYDFYITQCKSRIFFLENKLKQFA
jgi:hypothetical protein